MGVYPSIISEHISKVSIGTIAIRMGSHGWEKVLDPIIKKGDVVKPRSVIEETYRLPGSGELNDQFYQYDSPDEMKRPDDPSVSKFGQEIVYKYPKEQAGDDVTYRLYCGGTVFFYQIVHRGKVAQEGVFTSSDYSEVGMALSSK